MRVKSTHTPPCSGSALPSSDVPAPNPTIGTRAETQIVTISATSAVLSGNTTASGG